MSRQFLIDKNGCVVKRYGPMEEPQVGAFPGSLLGWCLGKRCSDPASPTGHREGPALLPLAPQVCTPTSEPTACAPRSLPPGTHDSLSKNQPAGGADPRTRRAPLPEEGPSAWPGSQLCTPTLGCLVGIKHTNWLAGCFCLPGRSWGWSSLEVQMPAIHPVALILILTAPPLRHWQS